MKDGAKVYYDHEANTAEIRVFVYYHQTKKINLDDTTLSNAFQEAADLVGGKNVEVVHYNLKETAL